MELEMKMKKRAEKSKATEVDVKRISQVHGEWFPQVMITVEQLFELLLCKYYSTEKQKDKGRRKYDVIFEVIQILMYTRRLKYVGLQRKVLFGKMFRFK